MSEEATRAGLAGRLGQRVVDDGGAVFLPAVTQVVLQESDVFGIQRRHVNLELWGLACRDWVHCGTAGVVVRERFDRSRWCKTQVCDIYLRLNAQGPGGYRTVAR